MAASNTRFTQNRLGQSKNPIDSDHGIYRYKEREFITLLGGAAVAWPVTARAQQAARIPRIGYLSPGSASGGFQGRDEAFRQALRDLGYVESSTIAIQYRFAEGRFDRLPELAAELVRLNVDIIVAVVTQASLAAKDATNSIPIVMVAVSDPVSSGPPEHHIFEMASLAALSPMGPV